MEYAEVPEGGTLAVLGLGPVGQFASRIGQAPGYRVLGVDPVPERRAMAERHGVETLDLTDDSRRLRDATDGRGPDSVARRRRMEAHGNPVAVAAQTAAGLLPGPIARKAMTTVGIDRLAAMHLAVRRRPTRRHRLACPASTAAPPTRRRS